MPENIKIIYDSSCKLCNQAVKFLKAGTREPGLSFFPSQSKDGEATLNEHEIPGKLADKTVILLDGPKMYIKSSAILKALQKKGGWWKLAGLFRIIPTFIRDAVYDFIARKR